MYDVQCAEPKVNLEEGTKTVAGRTRSGRVASQEIANDSPDKVRHQ